jgi:Fe-S cluster assembly scaffold protein SufB
MEGVTVISSREAWEKFSWTREFFKVKPKEGYFVWVQKQTDRPLSTCITIASKKISQNLSNLLVVEPGIKAKANVLCNALENNLCGKHVAKGKLLLKKGASLDYNHVHKWGEKDFVNPDYDFILEEGARLNCNYQNLLPPENLRLKTTIFSKKNSSSQMNFLISGSDSKINLEDTVLL